MDAHGGTLVGRGGPGQFLDSLAVDSGGYICVASPGGGAILVFPPEGGTPEGIEMPDFLTTNICFGGADLKTAYLTQIGRASWGGRVCKYVWISAVAVAFKKNKKKTN